MAQTMVNFRMDETLKGKMDAVCREMGIQAMQVMLKQAMMPVWDDTAMNGATALMGRDGAGDSDVPPALSAG